MRARFAQDPFDRLRQDHRQILDILDRMLQARDGDAARRGALLLSLKRTLAKHALAEEDVVYPALHGPAGSADAARSLYAEHAEMKIHLYALEQALMNGNSWGVQLPTLRQLIARHIQTEEDVEFPRLASTLDARASRAAASAPAGHARGAGRARTSGRRRFRWRVLAATGRRGVLTSP
jgi:hemerythrin superfamily protein